MEQTLIPNLLFATTAVTTLGTIAFTYALARRHLRGEHTHRESHEPHQQVPSNVIDLTAERGRRRGQPPA